MLYLTAVLTFLAGILFYTLSPREDRLNMEVFQGEPFIQSFLSQHQAAKDYLRRWYGVYVKDYSQNVFNLQPDFENYMSNAVDSEMCLDNDATNPLMAEDAPCFVSRVACVDATGANAIACNDSNPKNIYVVTYGGLELDGNRPAWWPKLSESRGRRYERWRRAFATRTTSSQTCGTVFVHEHPAGTHRYCLDTGVKPLKNDGTCAKIIPAGLIEALGYNTTTNTPPLDMFFCMSKVKQGPTAYYPANLTHFWDGLDNQNKHAPNSSSSTRSTSQQWLDLVGGQVAGNYSPDTKIFGNMEKATFDANLPVVTLAENTSTIDFDVEGRVLANDFTITLLVGFDTANLANPNIEPKATLLHFKNGYSASIDIKMISNTLSLELVGTDGGGYIFEADYNPLGNVVHFITLRRKGNTLSMYLGKNVKRHPLFEASFASDSIVKTHLFDTFNSDTGKMQMGNSDNNQKTYIYGVRVFDRGLTTDEIYDMYKEDSYRFPLYAPQPYTDNFNANLEWPEATSKTETDDR